MRAIISLLFAAVLMTGCTKKEPPVGVSGQPPKFGDYSSSEVEALRASISQLTFPLPEHTTSKMLPRPVDQLAVAFVDGIPDQEKKGRIGGNVVEYWLSRDHVLRVATAYYKEGHMHLSREEWAVILSREHRDRFDRPIYPGAGRARIPKQ
jgi:hypothetical protein